MLRIRDILPAWSDTIMETANSTVEWLRRRHELAQAVAASVQLVNPRLRVKGSFSTGQFHLLRDGRTTFSDLDLVLPDDGRGRHAWEQDVRLELERRGWSLRVSVQHFDSLGMLNAYDSRVLAFGELVRFHRRVEDRRFAAYIMAKTTLLVAGRSRGAQAGSPLSPAEADQAAQMARIGYSDDFGGPQARRLLGTQASTGVAAQYLALIETGNVSAAREQFLLRLEGTVVHPWLKARLRQLVIAGSSR